MQENPDTSVRDTLRRGNRSSKRGVRGFSRREKARAQAEPESSQSESGAQSEPKGTHKANPPTQTKHHTHTTTTNTNTSHHHGAPLHWAWGHPCMRHPCMRHGPCNTLASGTPALGMGHLDHDGLEWAGWNGHMGKPVWA